MEQISSMNQEQIVEFLIKNAEVLCLPEPIIKFRKMKRVYSNVRNCWNGSYYYAIITVSKRLIDFPLAVQKSILMHELIHNLNRNTGGFKHDAQFKNYCRIYSKILGYKIESQSCIAFSDLCKSVSED